jgi:hypothetical protein
VATRRNGLPYIWATWLAKALAGGGCLYSPWFKAHFKYEKFEEMATDLVQWNREHTRLMNARRQELDEAGYTVTVESQNEFRLQGRVAVVAGKPDLVATLPDRVLVVDGKTGRERDSDIWQVLLYLFAIPKSRPDLTGELEGEVLYKSGRTVTLTPAELAPRLGEIVSMIHVIASDVPPLKTPDRDNCKFCNIGPKDCPQRVQETRPVAVGEF